MPTRIRPNRGGDRCPGRSTGNVAPAVSIGQSIAPEILDLIAAQTRQQASFKYAKEDKIDLCNASLVCQAWKIPFQRAMYFDVTLNSMEDARSFLASGLVERMPTRTLRLGGDMGGCRSLQYEKVLRYSVSLRHLQVVVHVGGWVALDEEIMHNLQELQHLEMGNGVRVTLPKFGVSSLTLPNLRRLTIHGYEYERTIVPILHHVAMIALRYAHVRLGHGSHSFGGASELRALFNALGTNVPQLTTLQLSTDALVTSMDCNRAMEQLSHQIHLFRSLDKLQFDLLLHCMGTDYGTDSFESLIMTIPSTTPVQELGLKLGVYVEYGPGPDSPFERWLCALKNCVITSLPHLKLLRVEVETGLESVHGVLEERRKMLDQSRSTWDAFQSTCRTRNIDLVWVEE